MHHAYNEYSNVSILRIYIVHTPHVLARTVVYWDIRCRLGGVLVILQGGWGDQREDVIYHCWFMSPPLLHEWPTGYGFQSPSRCQSGLGARSITGSTPYLAFVLIKTCSL